MAAEYEESQCTFFGGDSTASDLLVRTDNVWHYNEVCLASSKIGTECGNRLYVFERIPGFRMDVGTGTGAGGEKEVPVASLSECEDLCLNQTDLPCRSASYDALSNKCLLSRETRHTNPYAFKSADPGHEYVENMCLKRESNIRTRTPAVADCNHCHCPDREQDVHFGGLHPGDEPRTGRQLRAGKLLQPS